MDEKFIAHCLELDIVTSAPTLDQVQKDIGDLILVQVSFAYENDNLDHLFKPAPKEVWEEFFKTPIETKKTKISKPKTPPIILSTSSYTSRPYA